MGTKCFNATFLDPMCLHCYVQRNTLLCVAILSSSIFSKCLTQLSTFFFILIATSSLVPAFIADSIS